jgi:hypothetical protein
MMEGMVEEKGILPERSEWFRSRRLIGTEEATDTKGSYFATLVRK